MSFLAPLYFLGALAVIGPIVFHLIRRQPKGEVEFSSLMFLDPTPPRLTRRSRLENLPLLLLRCLAILLLALAFARPFMTTSAKPSTVGEQTAVVLLIDTSASMRRSGVWDAAKKQAEAVLQSSDENTIISVIEFSQTPRVRLSLEESFEISSETRKDAARTALETLEPDWSSTDIGAAIRYAADQSATFTLPSQLETTDSGDESATGALDTRLVLISDVQSGAEIQSLQGYGWPDRVRLEVMPIKGRSGNASVRIAGLDAEASALPQSEGPSLRVQVSHYGDVGNSTFRLAFPGDADSATLVQVPPGESRFVSVPLPESDDERWNLVDLKMDGDDESFDNVTRFVQPNKLEQQVWFVGDESDAAVTPRDRLSFYIEQLPWSNTARTVTVSSVSPSDAWEAPEPRRVPLIVYGVYPPEESKDQLQAYLSSGGRVLIAAQSVPDHSRLTVLRELLGSEELKLEKADEGGFRLVSRVEFRDPLLQPLAEPGVSDFSTIRFWKHVRMEGLDESVDTILGLDDQSPLLVRRNFPVKSEGDSGAAQSDHGKLWVISSGWQPDQSQFGLSTKFVPLMLGMIGNQGQVATKSLEVGEVWNDAVQTEPGFFVDSSGNPYAVNLPGAESNTPAVDQDRFAQLGAKLTSAESEEVDELAERALRDVELESRQAWWQYFLLAAIGLVAVETWYSGRVFARMMTGDQEG